MSSSNIKTDIPPAKDEDQRESLDLDRVLIEELGQFGRYRLVSLALMVLPIMLTGYAANEYIFTTARIPSRCRIPQCDGDDPHPEFRPKWVLNAVPGTSQESFEECSRYADSNNLESTNETCPASWFNTTTIACEIITGNRGDRWGRRTALIISIFNVGWIAVLRSFASTYEWFLALAVFETICGSGAYSCSYILVMELVGPKYRVVTGGTMTSLLALGEVTIGLIAWGIQSWCLLILVVSLPRLLIISYFWILSESIRWLLSKGQYNKAETILKKVSRINKKQISDKSIKLLQATEELQRNINKPKEPWLIVLVLKSPTILLRCIVLSILQIVMKLINFGISVNSINLSGNKYLNYVFVTATEIPGYWTAVLLLDRIGRKPMLISAYWLCSVCQFAVAFMPDGMENLLLFIYLIGKYSIAIVMASIHVYITEMFPTKYRHRFFAFCAMMGIFGSIMAPLTPALALEVWEPLPSVLFGSLALLSGCLVFTTPETLGTKLPDTMGEAEQIESRRVNG